MQQLEADKWLFDYQLDGVYHSESFGWAPKWMTKEEARDWFLITFYHMPIAVMCIGESRIRK